MKKNDVFEEFKKSVTRAENVINLFPMDRFILRLFPNAKVYPDGVDCNFDLLKSKTIELIKKIFTEDVVGCYFNINSVEYWKADGRINVIDYNNLIKIFE